MVIPHDLMTLSKIMFSGRQTCQMDALFNFELVPPGASPIDIIRQDAVGQSTMPADGQNRLWKRFLWWIEWYIFKIEKGREPESLHEFVTWSQAR